MSKQGKEKAEKLVKEILKVSFPFCKHQDSDVCTALAKINGKAYELLKLLEHKEIE
jgi:hypothetical protein